VNITVKMVAIRPPAPPQPERKMELPEGATVADALAGLGLAKPDSHATLLNDESVPAGTRAGKLLKANDILTVFPPIHGG
jgi:sulfur carrier protein ThiS